MFLSCADTTVASENDDFSIDLTIFTKSLRIDGPKDQSNNEPTDQWSRIKKEKIKKKEWEKKIE